MFRTLELALMLNFIVAKLTQLRGFYTVINQIDFH